MNEDQPKMIREEVTECSELTYISLDDAITLLTEIKERYEYIYQNLNLNIDIEECYGDPYVEVRVTGQRLETDLEVEARVGKNKANLIARKARLEEELRLLEGRINE